MTETETTLKEKTAKGLFWGGFSSAMQQIIGIGFGIYFARMLTDDDYGLVGLLAIFSGIAGMLINCGFSTALVNKQDATHKDYNAVFWFSVFVSVFLYLILLIGAPLIAWFFKEPELTNLSRVVFLNFLFSGIGTVAHTIMLKQQKTRQMAIIDTVSLFIGGLTGMILVMNGLTYWAIVIQSATYISLASVLRIIVAQWQPSFDFDFSPLKEMFPFSVKLLLTGIFSQISANIFSVILGKYYTKTDVGIYNQGQKWMIMGQTFINNMISYVTQPVLAQINEERERQVKVLRKLIRFGAFISFPMMLGLAFVGKEFIIISIGEKWLPSVPFLQLFCIWGAVSFLWTFYTNLVYTQGKSNVYMYVSIFIGLLQVATVFALYPSGIYSMVVGYIFTYFIGLLIWHYHTKKLIGLRFRDVLKDTLPYLGITLLCFGIVWLITRSIQNLYLLLVLKIVISGILYIFAMKISNSVMFKESVEFLVQRIRRF